jgi:hypothetical protein
MDRSWGAALPKTIVILAISLVLLLSAVWLGCRFVMSHSAFRFSRIYAGDIRTDVLVAGNSRGINLITGGGTSPSVYNISYNGLGRASTISWIKAYFARGNTAKVIVIEATALFDNGAGCDGKPYWSLYGDIFSSQRAACPDDTAQARWAPLTAYNTEQFLRAVYYFTVKRGGDQDWANEYDIPPEMCAHLPVHDVEHFQSMAHQADVVAIRAQIDELKTWLKAHHVDSKIVFVVAPIFKTPQTTPMINAIAGKAKTLTSGNPTIDLSGAFGARCSFFADSIHVGREGRKALRPILFQNLAHDLGAMAP